MQNTLAIRLLRATRAGLVFASFALLSPALAPTEASAQQAQQGTSYEEFVKRGVQEFDQSNWEEALAMFSRAHALNPNARTFRGIGISAFELRRYVESIDALEASLKDERKPLSAQQREDAAALLQRARDYVAVYDLKLSPDSIELTVDGQAAKLREHRLLLDPGTHALVARAEGYVEQREQLHADAGAHEVLNLKLQKPGAGRGVAGSEDGGPQAPGARRVRRWTWGLSAAAVASGLTAIGLGVATSHKHDDLKQCRDSGSGARCSSGSGPALQGATNASIGVASAFAAAAVVAFFLEGRSHDKAPSQAQLLPTHNGLLLQGSF